MFDPRQAARLGSRTPPVTRSFTFTCACCDTTRIRRDASAPDGWVISYVDEASYVFCGDCAADPVEEVH